MEKSGQAILLVLIGVAITLTMVMSVVSSSITEIKLTSSETESMKAFSAAEAGIESALSGSSITSGDLSTSGGGSYVFNTKDLTKGATEYHYPVKLDPSDSASLWLVGRNDTGLFSCGGADDYCLNTTVEICWGAKGDTETTQLNVTQYYTTNNSDLNDYTDYKVIRGNYADFPALDCSNNKYAYNASVPIENQTILLKAKIIGSNNFQPIYFKTNDAFPSQGTKIRSTGQSGSSNRQIELIKTYESPFDIFDNAVYSVESIIKN